MAYTTNQLITQAWNLSGIVSADFQEPSPAQMSAGLDLLNELLALKTANMRLIPYFKFYDFAATVAEPIYFIPNLISIETITFNESTVRFSMEKQSRDKFFGAPRVDGIQSLPFTWRPERTLGGTNIYLYFAPFDNFPIKIFGKFSLASVMMNQNLSLSLDLFYISYLRFALAEYMCADYQISLSPQVQSKLDEFEELITDISPIDLTCVKRSCFNGGLAMTWGYVNFPGWTPK